MVPGPIAGTTAGAMVIELCDVVGDCDASEIVASIEVDRPHYSIRPGLIRKLLPIAVDADSGKVTAGGSYLFDSLENARAYLHWIETEYRVDGRLFHERPFVANFTCLVGSVIGAYDYASVETDQASKRVQIWQAAGGQARQLATGVWPALQLAGARIGLSSIWLGVEAEIDRIVLITVVSRTASVVGDDYEAWARLRDSQLTEGLAEVTSASETVHDACMWIFTIWRAPTNGKLRLGLWPNSPPLPAPPYHRTATHI